MGTLLEGKNAIVYGGGGGIGGGIARTLAREGARVFLAGRTADSLDTVAIDIAAWGGQAKAMPGMGSTGPADAGTEAFMRYLAAEVGPHGVRVCGLWTAAVAETLTQERAPVTWIDA